jgi:hypothetical protein
VTEDEDVTAFFFECFNGVMWMRYDRYVFCFGVEKYIPIY